MAKKHLTFDCPACGAHDEVVARVQGLVESSEAEHPVGEHGEWHCFACRSYGSWKALLEVYEG